MAEKPVRDTEPIVQVHPNWSYLERGMGGRKAIAWRWALCFTPADVNKPSNPVQTSSSPDPPT